MRSFAVVVILAACGGSKPPPTTSGPTNTGPDVKDARTAIERRRDIALAKIAPRLTDCAVADARAEMEAGRLTKKEFDSITAPPILKKNTNEYIEKLTVPMSSRQVRVLEVCFKEEAECGPLEDCLTHLQPGK